MTAPNKTLYVTDLDGTLLNDKTEISLESAEIINSLFEKGALVTFATARTPATVVELFRGVRINLPGIVMTGAACYDLATGHYSDLRFLEPDVAEKVVRVYAEKGVNEFIYTWRPDNVLHAYHPAPSLTADENTFYSLRRDLRLKLFHIGESPTKEALNHTLLIFAVGDRESLMNVYPALKEAAGYEISYYNDIFSDHNGYIEVFAPDVNKASAILRLKERYGAERVVAFGDNLNDLSMFYVADVSVAVANAYEEVKEKADIVIGNNNDNSVAKFILKDFTTYN